MSVSETNFVNHADSIERLFQGYQEWTKQRVVESLGGSTVPAHEIERSYDVGTMIREDIAKLSDPAIDTRLFVARDNRENVGCVYLDGRYDHVAGVKRLYVPQAARGGGLGWSLMDAAIAAAREGGYSRLLLFTAPSTEAAQSLHEILGFEYVEHFE